MRRSPLFDDSLCLRDECRGRPVPPVDLPAALTEIGRRWADFLSVVSDHPGGIERLQRRPSAQEWSALEYGCHVRDAVAAVTRNVELLLLVDCPPLRDFDGEEFLAQGWYDAQDPRAVADDIRHALAELAGLIQRHTVEHLDRVGAWNGRLVTGATLCRSALHEARHHLADADAGVPLPTA